MTGFSGLWTPPSVGDGISIIIPFRKSKKYLRQAENLAWTLSYWQCQLPGAEIIIGKDCSRKAFSKAVAVNAAAARATGDVFVIVDADGYIDINAVLLCVENIRLARNDGKRLWYIPYRQFFRLTDEASQRVLDSDPCKPYRFPTPPAFRDIDYTGEDHPQHHRYHRSSCDRGHWYGAVIQIMPREAFETVGGWDCRFRGWGGEDHSAMRAMDTLYWRHKTLPGQVLHLWHPMMDKDGVKPWVAWKDRTWEGQPRAECNGNLATRYSQAFGNVEKMRKLVNEGLAACKKEKSWVFKFKDWFQCWF
jgi:glycosyltransferase involved in cell wall biosynthesis